MRKKYVNNKERMFEIISKIDNSFNQNKKLKEVLLYLSESKYRYNPKYLITKKRYMEDKAIYSYANYKYLMNLLSKKGMEYDKFPYNELDEYNFFNTLKLLGIEPKDLPENIFYNGNDAFDYVDPQTGQIVFKWNEVSTFSSAGDFSGRPEPKILRGRNGKLYKIFYYHDGTPVEIKEIDDTNKDFN